MDSLQESSCRFENLFEIPLRNGLNRPTSVRGVGVKMVNMGELFANSRIGKIPMDRVQLSDKEMGTCLLKKGDLLFARQSLVWDGAGKCSIFLGDDEHVTFEGHLIRVRIDPTIASPDFYYYYFNSTTGRQNIEMIIQQVAAAGIRGSELSKLVVPLPPLSEQRAIARILGALDDKIELNRKMNATLEAMAQTLFKSWFVDFDPVTAKSEGRQPYGMNAETAALFPAEFVESELGRIPKGWETGKVGEEFNLIMGQSPPGETYNEVGDGVTIYQGRTDFGVRYPSPRVYCTAPTRFANPGDTLVSVRAPVGDINMAIEKCSIGRGLASIRHKSGSRSYTYYRMYFLREEFNVFEGEGTLFGSISGQSFRDMKIVLSPNGFINEFERKTNPLDQSIETNYRQLITLSTIRDTLLPKLLSGEIRVRDAEKRVERAV